ncbi:MAG: hypothetical protein AVDCRST_MAG77-5681 [uncultured Chloroflexi bacterium]|uniref:Uncharacterized protein n=1 Tax=uncultured Chloroflexota bacterium TaxID=166587 RepID=A0A6J4KDE4_9CHLR|nr:MAG: hypothetical protein AVDCRST_MAG77-5681 [uncultured Chloroflexota bacterium]
MVASQSGQTTRSSRRGRSRKVTPEQGRPPVDLQSLARQWPTLPLVDLPSLLGHVPGFSSRSAVFRRARAGTRPGLVRGEGHRAYVVTAVLVRHLLGRDAA